MEVARSRSGSMHSLTGSMCSVWRLRAGRGWMFAKCVCSSPPQPILQICFVNYPPGPSALAGPRAGTSGAETCALEQGPDEEQNLRASCTEHSTLNTQHRAQLPLVDCLFRHSMRRRLKVRAWRTLAAALWLPSNPKSVEVHHTLHRRLQRKVESSSR
jgi:hypothetical protein